MEIRMRVDPTDQRIGRGHCSIGDAVPEPLGFIAFPPEWLFYTEDTCTEDTAPQGCECAGINRHVVGDGKSPTGKEQRLYSDLESCGVRREAYGEA